MLLTRSVQELAGIQQIVTSCPAEPMLYCLTYQADAEDRWSADRLHSIHVPVEKTHWRPVMCAPERSSQWNILTVLPCVQSAALPNKTSRFRYDLSPWALVIPADCSFLPVSKSPTLVSVNLDKASEIFQYPSSTSVRFQESAAERPALVKYKEDILACYQSEGVCRQHILWSQNVWLQAKEGES